MTAIKYKLQNSQRNNQHKGFGFTLIEMIVTIAIVAIFATIAVPSFSELIRSNRIPTATNELVSVLVLARSEALKRSNNVTICASTDQLSCTGGTDYALGWMVFVDCNNDGNRTNTATIDCDNDGVANESETIIKVNNVLDSIFIGNASSSVTYNFAGRIAGPATTFTVGHDSTELVKDVVINRVGRVRTQDHP